MFRVSTLERWTGFAFHCLGTVAICVLHVGEGLGSFVIAGLGFHVTGFKDVLVEAGVRISIES